MIKMSKIKIIIASFFVLTIIFLYSSIYIVTEREQNLDHEMDNQEK